MYLHNSQINFNIRLAQVEEIKPMLSRKEIFEQLKQESPDIEHLSEWLDLEMA